MEEVVEDAADRAVTLVEAGFGAVLVENFGDVPFHRDTVPPETVAALTRCVANVRRATEVPVGVNTLRNDAVAALAVCAATGASFIRVNVLTGLMYTDQGPIAGRADEVMRARARLAPSVQVWADVFVKHATAPAGLTLERAAADNWERGCADALVLSGTATGHAVEIDSFRRIRAAVPSARLVVGSGADPGNLTSLAEVADHVIVGTAIEQGRRPGAALDKGAIEEFLAAAESAGFR